MGMRPIAEIMFADFAGVCFDQLANQLAKYRYMSGGQVRVPVTIRMANGAGSGFAAQHSQAAENWLLNIPGLKLVVPGTVEDLYGLLRSSVRDDNPVLFFEHKSLFAVKGVVDPSLPLVPLGKASVVRSGADVTIVAAQLMRHRAVAAASELAREGVEATVIDPRCLIPFDDATVVSSLERTSHLVVVQEGASMGSWGASLIARLLQEHFFLFDAPPLLIASDEIPVPYAEPMESAYLPDVDRIVTEVRKQVRG
jgi:pyruvate dehydrogenase E1 component beta subunit